MRGQCNPLFSFGFLIIALVNSRYDEVEHLITCIISFSSVMFVIYSHLAVISVFIPEVKYLSNISTKAFNFDAVSIPSKFVSSLIDDVELWGIEKTELGLEFNSNTTTRNLNPIFSLPPAVFRIRPKDSMVSKY